MLRTEAGHPDLLDQFLGVLRSLPDVRAELVRALASELGAQLALDVAGKPVRVLVQSRKAVYPRDVRELIWRIRDLARQPPAGDGDSESVAVLIAESISPGAKELLRAERIGYYDTGGSLYLPAPGAYLYVDRPPPKSVSRAMRSLYTGRRAQVLHGLLIHHHDWLGVKELAGLTRVSPATASQVLSELDRLEWMESRGQGPGKQRHVRDPAALLDAWVNQLSAIPLPAPRRYFVPATKPEDLLDRLGQVCQAHGVEYAVSFEAAAQRYAPFLSSISQVRCRLLAGSAAEGAIADLGARAVGEGANLAVIDAGSSGDLLFREQVGGAWLASPIQVYLDLMRSEGRAREMAEHLRRERIGF